VATPRRAERHITWDCPHELATAFIDTPVDEMMSLDGFVSKSDGIGQLPSRITGFRQIDPAGPTLFALEHDALIEAVNWWGNQRTIPGMRYHVQQLALGNYD
jgi:hypothetical protein